MHQQNGNKYVPATDVGDCGDACYLLFSPLSVPLTLIRLMFTRVFVAACDATVHGPRRADRQDASADQLQQGAWRDFLASTCLPL